MNNGTGTFEVVRFYDPAIDWPDDDGGKAALEYAETRDYRKLRFVDASVAVPQIFVCKHLTLAQRRVVTSAGDPAEIRRRAFSYGLEAVKNKRVDGAMHVTWYPKRRDVHAPMSDADLGTFPQDTVDEIGEAIRGMSFLDPDVPLRLQPLASSLAAFTAVRLRCAAQKADSRTQTGETSG